MYNIPTQLIYKMVITFITMIIIIWIITSFTCFDYIGLRSDDNEFAIAEWSNGDITYEKSVPVKVFKFQSEKTIKNIVYYKTIKEWNNKQGIEIRHKDWTNKTNEIKYTANDFISSDNVPFNVDLSHYIIYTNDKFKSDTVLSLYKQYGKNWPVILFKNSSYYNIMYQYFNQKTIVSLILYGGENEGTIQNIINKGKYDDNIPGRSDSYDSSAALPFYGTTARFYMLPETIDPSLEQDIETWNSRKLRNSMMPTYITDDNGQSYVNSLDSTDVMTKTSNQFVKDVIVQSNIKHTKFYN